MNTIVKASILTALFSAGLILSASNAIAKHAGSGITFYIQAMSIAILLPTHVFSTPMKYPSL